MTAYVSSPSIEFQVATKNADFEFTLERGPHENPHIVNPRLGDMITNDNLPTESSGSDIPTERSLPGKAKHLRGTT